MKVIAMISDTDYQPIFEANPIKQRERIIGLIYAAVGIMLMVFAVEANVSATAFCQQ